MKIVEPLLRGSTSLDPNILIFVVKDAYVFIIFEIKPKWEWLYYSEGTRTVNTSLCLAFYFLSFLLLRILWKCRTKLKCTELSKFKCFQIDSPKGCMSKNTKCSRFECPHCNWTFLTIRLWELKAKKTPRRWWWWRKEEELIRKKT